MALLALVAALALDHLYPLESLHGSRPRPYRPFTRSVNFLERHFNAGERAHGLVAWLLAVVPLAVGVELVGRLLGALSPLLSWLWAVAVLYASVNFKNSNDAVHEIAQVLKARDIDLARRLLARWRRRPGDLLTDPEIARLGIEQILVRAHRDLFGALFWFLVLGPAGAVLYRSAAIVAHKWGRLEWEDAGEFGHYAGQLFAALDWVPARLTALAYAIVGDFEGAMQCWRTQPVTWTEGGPGVVLASGAGALGVRLGEPVHGNREFEFRPDIGTGEEADADYLLSAGGLVWRALLLWLGVVLVLGLIG